MRLGVRAHDFGKLPAEVLAERISEKGFTSIQLTLHEAISDLNVETGMLNPGMAFYIREAFSKHHIQIAVLSCYINPILPDKEERKRQIESFKEFVRYARDFGCGIVATETGSINTDFSYHPGNHREESFKILLESLGEMVCEAEKFGIIAAIEGVEKFVASDPERIESILDSVKSNNLQVLFDPVNLLTIDNYCYQNRIIEDSFRLFGDRMVAFHAKDYKVENGRLETVQIGKGLMDYKLVTKLLRERKPYLPFILEEVDLLTLDETMDYLKTVYNQPND